MSLTSMEYWDQSFHVAMAFTSRNNFLSFLDYGITGREYERAHTVHEAALDSKALHDGSIEKLVQKHGFTDLTSFHEVLIRCQIYNLCKLYRSELLSGGSSQEEDVNWNVDSIMEWYCEKTLAFYPEDEELIPKLPFPGTLLEFLRGFRVEHLITCGW